MNEDASIREFRPTELVDGEATYPAMFYYRLCMHKDGKVLMDMSLNVPVECFEDVRLNTFCSLETLLVQYGKEHGYTHALPQQEEISHE